MCMSPSSLGNCTIYSTWCIMICLVIPILSLLLFIQSLYSPFLNCNFFHLLVSCPFFVITLVIALSEHLNNTYHYNILLGLVNIRSKGLTKQSWFIYFPGAKIFTFSVLLLQPAPIPLYIHVLMACIMVRTDDIRSERVNKEILLGKSYFHTKLQVHQLLHYNVHVCMYVAK